MSRPYEDLWLLLSEHDDQGLLARRDRGPSLRPLALRWQDHSQSLRFRSCVPFSVPARVLPTSPLVLIDDVYLDSVLIGNGWVKLKAWTRIGVLVGQLRRLLDASVRRFTPSPSSLLFEKVPADSLDASSFSWKRSSTIRQATASVGTMKSSRRCWHSWRCAPFFSLFVSAQDRD